MDLEQEFKNTLSCWPSGVTVVTTQMGDLLYGLTVSSFTSVSLDPPLILICLASPALPEAIHMTGRFAVSILADDQQAVSNYFATPHLEPTRGFVQVAGMWTPSGLPVIADAAGHLECKLFDMRAVGDHQVVVGQVERAVHRPDRAALVYHRRGYHGVA